MRATRSAAVWALAAVLIASPGRARADDPDPRDAAIHAKLADTVPLVFRDTPLEDILKFIRSATIGPNDNGIPIFVDPVALQKAEVTMTTPVTVNLKDRPLGESLKTMLGGLGLAYQVKGGLLTVTLKPRKP